MVWIMESQEKKSSSKEKMKIWRHENHPVALVTNEMTDQRLEYIHKNPVRAGICYTAEDHKYSSAGVYAGEEGVLEVELIT
jgi:putative transposase